MPEELKRKTFKKIGRKKVTMLFFSKSINWTFRDYPVHHISFVTRVCSLSRHTRTPGTHVRAEHCSRTPSPWLTNRDPTFPSNGPDGHDRRNYFKWTQSRGRCVHYQLPTRVMRTTPGGTKANLITRRPGLPIYGRNWRAKFSQNAFVYTTDFEIGNMHRGLLDQKVKFAHYIFRVTWFGLKVHANWVSTWISSFKKIEWNLE